MVCNKLGVLMSVYLWFRMRRSFDEEIGFKCSEVAWVFCFIVPCPF